MVEESYLDWSSKGKASPWRYLLGTGFILVTWLILGGVITALLIFIIGIARGENLAQITNMAQDSRILGPITYFLVLGVSFFLLLVSVLFVVRLIHARPMRSVVTGAPTINWKRCAAGFLLWLGLIAAGSLVEYIYWPNTFSVQFDAGSFLPFLLVALVIIPIQTSSEELFFRGYLVQAGSLISRNPFFLALFSGFLFMLPHLANPEVQVNPILVLLAYFGLGVFLAWISVKDGTIELALGIHAANNLFAGLFVTFPDSVLSTPAIFYTTHFDPLFGLIGQIVVCLVFYLVIFKVLRRETKSDPLQSSLE